MSTQKINARSCVIEELEAEAANIFLEMYHRQGAARSLVQLGLFYETELLQVLTIGKPRFNKNYQWEIIRECTKENYLVRGGTSKLWKYFLQHYACHSCICYSYPHNGKFTDHYINYCGFRNIKRSKEEQKIYFVGQWNGKVKYIDKSILERHGVDRLLRTKQGQNRTNEKILLDLGFEKIIENGYSPQIDIYYPFSVLYKIQDLDDDTFYIGMCESKRAWEQGYMGSGQTWIKHLEAHPNHHYKRIILKKDFKTPKKLRDAELAALKEFTININNKIKIDPNSKCRNVQYRTQGQMWISPICPECNGKGGKHKSSCSQYDPNLTCKEISMTLNKYKTNNFFSLSEKEQKRLLNNKHSSHSNS